MGTRGHAEGRPLGAAATALTVCGSEMRASPGAPDGEASDREEAQTRGEEKERETLRAAYTARPEGRTAVTDDGAPPRLGAGAPRLCPETTHVIRAEPHGEGRPATEPVMILPQVHLRKPCYDFYFL